MVRPALRIGGAGLILVVAGCAVFAAVRLLPALPVPALQLTSSATWTPIPGTPPAVPGASTGGFALDVTDATGTRRVAATDEATARPTGSVAKTLTALVVLEQHPLAPGSDGPVLVMTARDVADYVSIGSAGGSVAPVHLGERISERQLLLGLMLPSANNMALTLARWVDDGVAAFVDRLNSRAVALGMTHTHFADPDGLSPATVSSPADLVRLGEAAMANPALVAITSTQSDTLPDGTVITNLDTLLAAEPTWIGVKTGWTPQAGGCLLFAARYVVAPGAVPVTVVGAILGQPPDAATDREHPELGTALRIARAAVTAVLRGYAPLSVPASALPPVTAVLTDRASHRTLTGTTLAGAPVAVALQLGETLDVSVDLAPLGADLPAGSTVATVTVTRGTRTLGTWRLVTTTAIVAPSVGDRLFG